VRVSCAGLDVHNLEINRKTPGRQTSHDSIVGCDVVGVAPTLEGLLKDEVAIGMLGNHNIVVARAGLDGRPSHVICVELADGG
jgi:hypothetical protein